MKTTRKPRPATHDLAAGRLHALCPTALTRVRGGGDAVPVRRETSATLIYSGEPG
jgi:hypothetical protein